MGVSQLPPIIKKTKGVLACELKDKKSHVDLLSLHFGVIRVLCYNVVATEIRRTAAAEAMEENESMVKKRRATELPVQRPTKRRKGVQIMSVKRFLDDINLTEKFSSRSESQVCVACNVGGTTTRLVN